jgi:hypothetical protein
VRDPLGIRSAGAFDVPCQIVHIERLAHGTVADIVTLAPCDRSGEPMPAGTPLALGFGADPTAAVRSNLETALSQWEASDEPLRLQVDEVPEGLRYRFSDGQRFLVLLVEDLAA